MADTTAKSHPGAWIWGHGKDKKDHDTPLHEQIPRSMPDDLPEGSESTGSVIDKPKDMSSQEEGVDDRSATETNDQSEVGAPDNAKSLTEDTPGEHEAASQAGELKEVPPEPVEEEQVQHAPEHVKETTDSTTKAAAESGEEAAQAVKEPADSAKESAKPEKVASEGVDEPAKDEIVPQQQQDEPESGTKSSAFTKGAKVLGNKAFNALGSSKSPHPAHEKAAESAETEDTTQPQAEQAETDTGSKCHAEPERLADQTDVPDDKPAADDKSDVPDDMHADAHVGEALEKSSHQDDKSVEGTVDQTAAKPSEVSEAAEEAKHTAEHDETVPEEVKQPGSHTAEELEPHSTKAESVAHPEDAKDEPESPEAKSVAAEHHPEAMSEAGTFDTKSEAGNPKAKAKTDFPEAKSEVAEHPEAKSEAGAPDLNTEAENPEFKAADENLASKSDTAAKTVVESLDAKTDPENPGAIKANEQAEEAKPEDAQTEAPDAIKANEQAEDTKPEDVQAEAAESEEKVDLSVLKGCTVNKGGNLINDKGEVVGRVKEGILAHLVGRAADAEGQIWNDGGAVVGRAEPIPENEREKLRESAPFESFEGATVDADGFVIFNGEKIGKVVEGSGDLKILRGKIVDPDGDILDKSGNVIGKAERWEEEKVEAELEVEVDRSILAGKRCNKAGNIVDGAGVIFGRVVEGDVKRMVGRMCNKEGFIVSESGDKLGRAEVVPEGEREGFKEGPFAELSGCTVAKNGHVVTPAGDVVGRVVKGDPLVLFGREVDEDGDVLDRNGNQLGHAERWEPEVVEKKKSPLAGRRVNREGNVVDEDGNVVARLTSGDLTICVGKEVDDDGDVVNSKGVSIGHVSLLEDIPPEPEPEPEGESAEEKEKREQLEKDQKLARQLAFAIEQCLEKVKPLLNDMKSKIEKAENTPKEERDEEQVVREVRPLIEEAGRMLSEANGAIRGLDPDGRIQQNAKFNSSTREATPEEHHLAEVLKELTGTVEFTIRDCKKRLDNMPRAKKELNPLWGLLNEPLLQILGGVGLLLNGVLSLVGRLLSGLGLGGLVDNLLGTLGLNRVLGSLGLGSATKALTGKK